MIRSSNLASAYTEAQTSYIAALARETNIEQELVLHLDTARSLRGGARRAAWRLVADTVSDLRCARVITTASFIRYGNLRLWLSAEQNIRHRGIAACGVM